MEDYFHPEPSHKILSSDASQIPPQNKSMDSHEAVRRGLSFGPIKKTPRHHSTSGILKSTFESPSPSSKRRSTSADDDDDDNDNDANVVNDGEGRIPKDRYPKSEGSRDLDSSEDEERDWSSEDEAGRGRSPKSKDLQNTDDTTRTDSEESQPILSPLQPKIEAEALERTTSKKFVVHPNTNFDKPATKPTTRTASPTLSEEEEIEATERAQALPIFSSQQDTSVAHRAIQTLIRGDFGLMQQEAREGMRRLRTYLAATDLSGEAAFALEWTIGTVMRDGDTLFAVYAVDEVVGTGKAGDSLPIGEGAAAMRDTAALMETMTDITQKASLRPFPSPLSKKSLRPSSRKGSTATSTDSRALSVAQQERLHALQTLQDTCLGLLRKTGLQCRIVIEVIHCKSPKYMITEAVSRSGPTL